MMHRLIPFLAIVLLACLHAPALAGEPFKIIVNSANPTTTLTRESIAKLFIKRVMEWSDGELAYPVDQAPDSSVRVSFSESIHGRSITAVKSYWQKQIFAGRGVPPPELSGDAAVMDFVKRTRGAIGYVSDSAITTGVKVVEISN